MAALFSQQVVYMEEPSVVALLDQIQRDYGLRSRSDVVRQCVRESLRGGLRSPVRRHFEGVTLSPIARAPKRGRSS